MMSRPTAFFVHTDLVPRGGLEAVGAWMLESLKSHYDMAVLTWSPPDLAGLNAIYGTHLRHDDARWISPGPAMRRAVELFPSPTAWWQKRSWLMRMSRRLHPAHDVVLSSTSEFDFGRPGIQYVNYPWMATMYVASQREGRPASRRMLPALARRARRPWMALAGFRFSSMLENLTLASSNWGAEVYRRAYGRDALTLYPPVAGAFAETPWEERQDVAEMARADLLAFVHDSGGQVEIVEEPALRFASDDEAVERIDRVLSHAALRQDVMARLRRRAGCFSPDRFRDELLRLVEAWRARHAAAY